MSRSGAGTHVQKGAYGSDLIPNEGKVLRFEIEAAAYHHQFVISRRKIEHSYPS
jgi:hypothetical protein